MAFKFLFLLSLVLGSVFLDAIGLVEYEDEISSLDKLEWGFAERIFFFFIRATYRREYLKRSIMYSYGHPGSFNPAVILTNKEAHMIYMVTWTRKLAPHKLPVVFDQVKKSS